MLISLDLFGGITKGDARACFGEVVTQMTTLLENIVYN